MNSNNLLGLSRSLRNNMTREEKKLWYGFLRKIPYTVNRQKVLGRYIVDFYCAELRIVIELDGSQHYSEKGLEYDRERDEYLAKTGNIVLRYSNYDLKTNYEGVCLDLIRAFRERSGDYDIEFPCPVE